MRSQLIANTLASQGDAKAIKKYSQDLERASNVDGKVTGVGGAEAFARKMNSRG